MRGRARTRFQIQPTSRKKEKRNKYFHASGDLKSCKPHTTLKIAEKKTSSLCSSVTSDEVACECEIGTRNPSDYSRELAAARLADKIGLMGSPLIVTNPSIPAIGSPHELTCHQHHCRETFSTPCGCDTTASPPSPPPPGVRQFLRGQLTGPRQSTFAPWIRLKNVHPPPF